MCHVGLIFFCEILQNIVELLTECIIESLVNTVLAFSVIAIQFALLILYWVGLETYFKSDILCQAVWGRV